MKDMKVFYYMWILVVFIGLFIAGMVVVYSNSHKSAETIDKWECIEWKDVIVSEAVNATNGHCIMIREDAGDGWFSTYCSQKYESDVDTDHDG